VKTVIIFSEGGRMGKDTCLKHSAEENIWIEEREKSAGNCRVRSFMIYATDHALLG
jgi:hypothetical protein